MIYISFGVCKSASTFIYSITEEIFALAGRPVARLSKEIKGRNSPENYIDPITGDAVDAAGREIGSKDVVIKTHGAPDARVKQYVESGAMLASAIIRDPREIALALVDHGARSRRMGIPDFAEFERPLQTTATIADQLRRFTRWATIKGVEVFTYDQICFDTERSVQRLISQIGFDVSCKDVVQRFSDKYVIRQYNKGVMNRFREMPLADQQVFIEEFSDYYDDNGHFIIDNRNSL